MKTAYDYDMFISSFLLMKITYTKSV